MIVVCSEKFIVGIPSLIPVFDYYLSQFQLLCECVCEVLKEIISIASDTVYHLSGL